MNFIQLNWIVIIICTAGKAVDQFIDQLVDFLEPGDIIIDGGNSEHQDTTRRCASLAEKGILYVGSGVSGGEEGARYGPSLMPGGDVEAWPHIKPIFQSIAAKVDGESCCDWVGQGGAGHFVKMVHNGIEYGDMQLIAEAYHLMKSVLGLTPPEMADVFDQWNKGELDSFLIEITANILRFQDEKGDYLVEKIRDSAGQKGTGKWTAIAALDYGVPVTLIGEAVFARCLSSLQAERIEASKTLPAPVFEPYSGERAAFIEAIRRVSFFCNSFKIAKILSIKMIIIWRVAWQALYASKIVSYAQGFMLLREAAKQYNWQLNYGGIALMWRGGCIIRRYFFSFFFFFFFKLVKGR